jgi:hypothetical protein
MKATKPKAATKGKFADNEKCEPSANQMSPGLASPNDFEPLENGGQGGETLPFDGSCGDTASEYRRLLARGRKENKHEFTPPDQYGRSLSRLAKFLLG